MFSFCMTVAYFWEARDHEHGDVDGWRKSISCNLQRSLLIKSVHGDEYIRSHYILDLSSLGGRWFVTPSLSDKGLRTR